MTFWRASQKSEFSGAIFDQTRGHTGYQQVPNERYWHDLSIDAPSFTEGQVVLHQVIPQPLKVNHFFQILKNTGK